MRQVKQASPLLRVAERLLVFEAGGAIRTSEEGLAVASRIHEKLVQHLSPVVGEFGLQALLARSVTIAKPAFSGLCDLPPHAPAEQLLTQLCACLKTQGPAVIADIITALMVTFIGLLSTFIGEGLTWRLLRNTWPEALATQPPSRDNP